MRKSTIAGLLATSVLLGGCQGGFSFASIQDAFNNAGDLATQAQQYAVNVCKFEPTLTSVGAVIAAFFPGGAVGADAAKVVGDAICAAVKAPSASFAADLPLPAAKKATTGTQTLIVKTPKGGVVVRGVRKPNGN